MRALCTILSMIKQTWGWQKLRGEDLEKWKFCLYNCSSSVFGMQMLRCGMWMGEFSVDIAERWQDETARSFSSRKALQYFLGSSEIGKRREEYSQYANGANRNCKETMSSCLCSCQCSAILSWGPSSPPVKSSHCPQSKSWTPLLVRVFSRSGHLRAPTHSARLRTRCIRCHRGPVWRHLECRCRWRRTPADSLGSCRRCASECRRRRLCAVVLD